MLLHIKDLPFSTSVDVSALCIKSRRSVEGTSPWLSLMTPALKVVGHLSMNLLAVCSPNITLKSCSICSLKKKKKKKRRTTWVGTLCYILQYVSVFNECRCHTSPGVSRNRGNTEKTSADLFSSLTMAWRYAKVTFIFSRMVSSSAVSQQSDSAFHFLVSQDSVGSKGSSTPMAWPTNFRTRQFCCCC